MSIMGPTDDQVQGEFDQFVINGLNLVHDKKMTPKILKTLKGNPDTVDAVAEMALILTNRILSAKKTPISGAAFINGINVMVGELITLAESAGANPLNEEQRYQAYSSAISQTLKSAVKSGRMKKSELEKIKAKMEQEGGAMPQEGQPMPQEQPQQPPQGQQPMPQQQPQGQQPQASQRQPMPQQKPGILGGR